MRQVNLNLTQKFNIKNQIPNTDHLFKKKKYYLKNMEIQHYQIPSMDLENRKQSQNTCHSSNSNSPNLDQKTHDQSAVKSLKAFSTGTSSPGSHDTPQKVFCAASMDNFSSLQKRTSAIVLYEKITPELKAIKSQTCKDIKMDVQTCIKNIGSMDVQENEKKACQQQVGINIIQPKYKQQQLARLGQNQKINIENQKSQQKCSLMTQQVKIQSETVSNVSISKPQPNQASKTQSKDPRPLPSYKQARPALYIWIRTLCFQLNMCFDVFGLTMKYLDQYHTTYGYSYERSTFSALAYGMIILASKVMNKKILTPTIIASKTSLKRQNLQQIQMNLINLMCYKVYFETFIKLLQRKFERWEEICHEKNLRQFSLFDQNLESFKRFYLIIREVQIFARENKQINDEMLLDCFMKVLISQFRHSGKQETLCQIIYDTFSCSEEQINLPEVYDLICSKIKSFPTFDLNDFQSCERINKNFERRNNKDLYPVYSIFMNSIFDIKF